MNAPPRGLTGAALLFWGSQTGNWVAAILMAVLLEAAPLLSWRLDLTEKDFHRVADLSSLVFLILIVYLFSTRSVQGIYGVLEWLPGALLLPVAAQVCSLRGSTPLAALFLSLRRRPAGSPAPDVDLRYPYFIACLLAAAAGNRPGAIYFVALALFAAWALWPVRPLRWKRVPWLLLFGMAVALAFLLQSGMAALQTRMEYALADWFNELAWSARDPERARTAIGSISRLKLSDRIDVRVQTDPPPALPLLLREATYTAYSFGTWSAPADGFERVEPEPGRNDTWQLAAPQPAPLRVRIDSWMARQSGVLPLPEGAQRITGSDLLEIQRNSVGAVVADTHAGHVRYEVQYGGRISDGPPQPRDLAIPEQYRPDFAAVAAEIGVPAATEAETLARVERFFAEHFSYSLPQGRQRWGRPLTSFLLGDRRGHCEYFATATALLLRHLGIPARYAVGYSVQEWSPLEQAYVARGRHAHSWVLAWIDGAWRSVDTTPPVWVEEDTADQSEWLALRDVLSWLRFRYARLLADDGTGQGSGLAIWLVPPLAAVLAWRLYRRRRRAASAAPPEAAVPRAGRGLDSELFRVMESLSRGGLGPRDGETSRAWLARLGRALPGLGRGELQTLLSLHYRLRFDPEGLPGEERERLRRLCLELQGTSRVAIQRKPVG